MIPVTPEQAIVFVALLVALVLFIDGRLRYDIVALLSLFIVTITGVVGWDRAFLGFANPAVITVAAVLVISRGLHNAGFVELIARRLSRLGDRPTVQVSALTGLVTALSALMNNVGALALLMPVGIRMARWSGRSPSALLLALAFGSCLGGLITLIGTPTNIIIATYRAEHSGSPFTMFDFTPVGLGVALAGLLFIGLVGWRLVPERSGRATREDLFGVEDYLTEVRVPGDSSFAGSSLERLDRRGDVEVAIVELVHRESAQPSIERGGQVEPGDTLVVRGSAGDLKSFIDEFGFTLAEDREVCVWSPGNGQVTLLEAVIRPDSPIIGRTVREIELRSAHGLNLIAVSRPGERLGERLSGIRFRSGDVLLLKGTSGTLEEALKPLGCHPLAERGLRLGEPRRIAFAVGVFGLAIGFAALGLLPVEIVFSMAAVAMVLVSLVPLREIYRSIDWPIIVLLGALLPVVHALESTGGAHLIASSLLSLQGYLPETAILLLIMAGTMLISNVINNAATAVLMAPIAVSLAGDLGASTDAFLMAIAVGASAPFLTPIGHQSNALVMRPAGLKFGDYWRLGLPLSVIVVVVATYLIPHFWPL